MEKMFATLPGNQVEALAEEGSDSRVEKLVGLRERVAHMDPKEFLDFLTRVAEKGFYSSPESRERQHDGNFAAGEVEKDMQTAVFEILDEIG